jgi:hypothetical protein
MKNSNGQPLMMILTHGRPDRVHTYDSLRRQGYTGRICILIDNEDKMRAEYKRKFGDQVYVFDKVAEAKRTDAGDNFPHRKAIVYARNASFRAAKDLGYRYFVQLDDDYTKYHYRFDQSFDFTTTGNSLVIKSMDKVIEALNEFYKQSGATAMSMSQAGDFIGGEGNMHVKNGWILKRKCMNFWFCDTEKPVQFMGHMNEDCTAYVIHGLRGGLFFHVALVALTQMPTQQTAGGMTDVYLESGTYVKTFYTVMAAPSCTKINTVCPFSDRIHHSIKWNNACPKIIDEKWRKAA